MELKVKYSNRLKKGVRLAAKRGLNINLLEDIVVKLKSRIPLDVKHKDYALSGNYKLNDAPFLEDRSSKSVGCYIQGHACRNKRP